MSLYVRLERSDAILAHRGPNLAGHRLLGPYEWVQLTYAELRTSPDGDVLAVFDPADEGWYLAEGHTDARLHESPLGRSVPFSDVIVY